MKPPERVTDGARDGVGARLVRSAREDVPPAASRRRAMAAAALAASTVSSVSIKAAAGGALTRAATIKWLAWGGGLALAVSLGAAVISEGDHVGAPSLVATIASASSTPPVSPALDPLSPALGPSLPSPVVVPDPRTPARSEPGAAASAGSQARAARSTNAPRTTSEGVRASHDAPQVRSTLTQEIAVLDEAKLALDDSRPDAALTILDRHAREFPQGSLSPEATALRIEARYRRGDHAGAAALFRRFQESNPKSPLLEHVRPFASSETK